MYKDKSFLAIIPARGGSKGIPRKNIIDVHGKPLITYTIEAALQSKYIDRVIVSTDDEEIAAIGRKWGAEIPFLRPAELATDEAKTIDAILHAIKSLREKYDYVITLQPTQPLRTSQHIDQSIEEIIEKKFKNLVSVSSVKEHPVLIRRINQENHLKPLIDSHSTIRRQDFQPYYLVNGAIYINKVEDIAADTSLNDNEGFYIVKDYLIDIDEIYDLEILNKEISNGQ
ncbi:acylneuraminate cytidylyltransferase [Sporosarcina sp. P21c]|uniref:acylneuraminate cytidylyltransferase family protein n=1 Tax=Sporosarcina sp. P21c TaxID=2048255 RepID=UPI000C1630EA|nr:acylneuraminate cytidylyltransferase family protein [Sporosarcina sp. P21c]PIC88551.1 acylneuraminate cytidylyltransferase [Sporosarcina sp. P21c]